MSKDDVGQLTERIEGTITLVDGTTSQFSISPDAGSQQWGADIKRLGHTVDIVGAMAAWTLQEDLLATSDQVDAYEIDDICDEPGCMNTLTDGEGYDGYCGDHADQREKAGEHE